MLPTGHIEFTWATLNLVQRRTGSFRATDYRLAAVAALAPDLLDKPLALTIYRDADAALFWGHNLWFHGAIWLAAWALVRRARSVARGVRFVVVLPYLLAFSGHLIADRMWGFQDTLFYPLSGGHWHRWVHVGEPAAMLQAYLDIVRATPLLVVFEIVGLALVGWMVWDRRLWQKDRLRVFLRTGRVGTGTLGRECDASTQPISLLSRCAMLIRSMIRC